MAWRLAIWRADGPSLPPTPVRLPRVEDGSRLADGPLTAHRGGEPARRSRPATLAAANQRDRSAAEEGLTDVRSSSHNRREHNVVHATPPGTRLMKRRRGGGEKGPCPPPRSPPLRSRRLPTPARRSSSHDWRSPGRTRTAHSIRPTSRSATRTSQPDRPRAAHPRPEDHAAAAGHDSRVADRPSAAEGHYLPAARRAADLAAPATTRLDAHVGPRWPYLNEVPAVSLHTPRRSARARGPGGARRAPPAPRRASPYRSAAVPRTRSARRSPWVTAPSSQRRDTPTGRRPARRSKWTTAQRRPRCSGAGPRRPARHDGRRTSAGG